MISTVLGLHPRRLAVVVKEEWDGDEEEGQEGDEGRRPLVP